MNVRDLPGPGDAITWGPIGPNDPRRDDDGDALDVAIETTFQSYMATASFVSDARGEFTCEEDAIITACVMAGDFARIGEITTEATQRVIRGWAEKKARQQLDKLDREAEDDHYADQVAA